MLRISWIFRARTGAGVHSTTVAFIRGEVSQDAESLLVDHAAFHHERDLLQYADVRERVSRHCDDVGEIARLQRADLSLPAEQLRAVQRAGLDRGERRHPVLHHEREFAGLRAVRKRSYVGAHGDGNTGRELFRQFVRVHFLQFRDSARLASGVAA